MCLKHGAMPICGSKHLWCDTQKTPTSPGELARHTCVSRAHHIRNLKFAIIQMCRRSWPYIFCAARTYMQPRRVELNSPIVYRFTFWVHRAVRRWSMLRLHNKFVPQDRQETKIYTCTPSARCTFSKRCRPLGEHTTYIIFGRHTQTTPQLPLNKSRVNRFLSASARVWWWDLASVHALLCVAQHTKLKLIILFWVHAFTHVFDRPTERRRQTATAQDSKDAYTYMVHLINRTFNLLGGRSMLCWKGCAHRNRCLERSAL